MSHQQPTDELDDPGITHTDADETSETRFGPRPVPEGHHRSAERPESRRIPPHGDVSPDGSRAYPRPSRLAKWVVWGGTGLAAAALTVGTVYAARGIAEMISGHDGGRPRRPRPSPHPSAGESRPSPLQFSGPAADRPAAPQPRPRRPQKSLMEEIEANTATLTSSVDNVMHSVTAAVAGFRNIAAQANSIVHEFGDAADLVRDILDRGASDRSQGAHRADPEDENGPADHDPRSHRL